MVGASVAVHPAATIIKKIWKDFFKTIIPVSRTSQG